MGDGSEADSGFMSKIFNAGKRFITGESICRKSTTTRVDTWEEFLAALEAGGFVEAHWDGTSETEDLIKKETKATIRCIPLEGNEETGKCVRTGADSAQRVVFARAY